MTSFRWLGINRSEDTTDALLRMAHLLLQGIAMHAVVGDKSEHEAFQADLTRLQQSLGQAPSAHEILVVTGAVVKTLEDYNRRVSRFVHAENVELERIVTMLTDTVATVSSASNRTVARLQDISKQIERASVIENLQMLRVQLGDCLSTVREEVVRQRSDASTIVEQLTGRLTAIHNEPSKIDEPSAPDELTGLPRREAAIQQIESLAGSEQPFYLALFSVERLRPITERFGPQAGDQVVLLLCQHLAQHFERLYRWCRAGFVAVIQRSGQPRLIADEVARVARHRLERTLHISGRSVLLPVVSRHEVISAAGAFASDLVERLDHFFSPGGLSEKGSE